MSIKILVLLALAIGLASSQTASFVVEGQKATLIADWVQRNT